MCHTCLCQKNINGQKQQRTILVTERTERAMASLLVLEHCQISLIYTKFKLKHFGLFLMARTQFEGRQIERKNASGRNKKCVGSTLHKILHFNNIQSFYLWEILYSRTPIIFIGSAVVCRAFPLPYAKG